MVHVYHTRACGLIIACSIHGHFFGNQGDPAVWPLPIPVHSYRDYHHTHLLETTYVGMEIEIYELILHSGKFSQAQIFLFSKKKKKHTKTEFSQF